MRRRHRMPLAGGRPTRRFFLSSSTRSPADAVGRVIWCGLLALLGAALTACDTAPEVRDAASPEASTTGPGAAADDAPMLPFRSDEARPGPPPPDAGTAAAQPRAEISPFPGVVVAPAQHRVELEAVVVLDAGWLEQIACTAGTREHESLLVPHAMPSQVHAALLAAGFEPGRPGRWRHENGAYVYEPPLGAPLDVAVRYRDAEGEVVEEPVSRWIRDHHGRRVFPDGPWIFGGSRVERVPETLGGDEHYTADLSGSIIGLVTFGDEVIGFGQVIADEVSVAPPEWEVFTERVPPIGTPVTIILRARADDG